MFHHWYVMTTLTPAITDTMGNGQQVLYNDGKNGNGLRLTWGEDQTPNLPPGVYLASPQLNGWGILHVV